MFTDSQCMTQPSVKDGEEDDQESGKSNPDFETLECYINQLLFVNLE